MNTNQQSDRSETRRWHMQALAGAGLAIMGMLFEPQSARGASEACIGVEFVNLHDPVVTLVEGTGDLEAEQALWSEVELPQLEAPLAIVLNHRTFALERLP
jgi:hypothetical protein